MTTCEHAQKPVYENFKGRLCDLTDKQPCWNYDDPTLVAKCPVRRGLAL